ncbi:MAG TPA: SurA N-terminal domain-containing protein [Candidatus Sulfotelmatobacter sp.]|jgi:parvulin-like peptidyl-prolyl isomerase|nr:SurA N-terminal domain-containing protein [Candidatus Sulfotelmatobacter sp.]
MNRSVLPANRCHDTMSGVSRIRRSSAIAGVLAAVFAAVALVSCGRGPADPAGVAVAEVGGRSVTLAQLQAYLATNLMTPEGAETLPAGELDRVKSRLFDDFIDEEVLLQEAQRRGIVATDADLADYLGAEPPKDPAAREVARREIVVQKLREAAVRGRIPVDEGEIDAWLKSHDAPAATQVHGRLRVLRFASYPEAARVRADLASKKLTFDKALATYGSITDPGSAPEVDLAALPDRLAAAVAGLKPGEVSPPVSFESSVLLLLLESIDDPSLVEARRRDRARTQIALSKSGVVAGALLKELRGRTAVRIHPSALPFAYVAESRNAGTQ